MKNYFTLLFHLLMFHGCLWVIYLTSKEPVTWYHTISYLTNQTHYFMTIYYLICAVQDSFQLRQQKIVYSAFIHSYYQQVQALSLMVCINFWKIYYRDSKLMIDRQNYNWELSYYMHGINTLVFWLEPLITKHYCHKTCVQKITNHLLFVVYYLSYTYIYLYVVGEHIYPFQALLQFNDICMMYIQMIIATVAGDLILSKLFITQINHEKSKSN